MYTKFSLYNVHNGKFDLGKNTTDINRPFCFYIFCFLSSSVLGNMQRCSQRPSDGITYLLYLQAYTAYYRYNFYAVNACSTFAHRQTAAVACPQGLNVCVCAPVCTLVDGVSTFLQTVNLQCVNTKYIYIFMRIRVCVCVCVYVRDDGEITVQGRCKQYLRPYAGGNQSVFTFEPSSPGARGIRLFIRNTTAFRVGILRIFMALAMMPQSPCRHRTFCISHVAFVSPPRLAGLTDTCRRGYAEYRQVENPLTISHHGNSPKTSYIGVKVSQRKSVQILCFLHRFERFL